MQEVRHNRLTSTCSIWTLRTFIKRTLKIIIANWCRWWIYYSSHLDNMLFSQWYCIFICVLYLFFRLQVLKSQHPVLLVINSIWQCWESVIPFSPTGRIWEDNSARTIQQEVEAWLQLILEMYSGSIMWIYQRTSFTTWWPTMTKGWLETSATMTLYLTSSKLSNDQSSLI